MHRITGAETQRFEKSVCSAADAIWAALIFGMSGNQFNVLVRPPYSSGSEAQSQHMVFAPHPEASAHSVQLIQNLGTFRRPTAKTAEVLRKIGYYELPAEVWSHMRNRKPDVNQETWGQIQQFVEDSVSVAGPQLPYGAGLVQSVVAKYVEWVLTVKHLPLDGKLIWSRQLIDLYATDPDSSLKPGTRRNYRSYLDRISKVLCPDEHPYTYTPQNRKSTVAPYSAGEMEQFRAWAVNQSNPTKRRRAMAMLALCVGAGLASSEVALITPKQVEITSAGIVIEVPGNSPRRVPVVPEWDSWVRALVEDWPKDRIVWDEIKRKDHSNLLSTFVENAEGKGPRGDRLRNTWLVWHLNNRTPMKDLFYAAGFRKMEHLARLLAHCEFLPADQYVSVLRGEAN
ncbi:hypothetical protein ACR5KS_12240 [Leucobacter sp. W1153]|uniref:hypothetical protein n=1 Tax=Leucobacter sp. W1153 TaxID=3439064 RepID=UPI003F3273B1